MFMEILDTIGIISMLLGLLFIGLIMKSLIKKDGGIATKLKYAGLSFFVMFICATVVGTHESNLEEKHRQSGHTEKVNEDVEEVDGDEVKHVKIGETVNFNGVELTLNSVRVEMGGEFDELENEQFVVVNMTAKNTSEEKKLVSSYINLELFDEEGYKYEDAYLEEGIQGKFDGELIPGGKLRGEAAFNVPKALKYELHFSDSIEPGKIIWKIDFEEFEK